MTFEVRILSTKYQVLAYRTDSLLEEASVPLPLSHSSTGYTLFYEKKVYKNIEAQNRRNLGII